MEKEPITCQGLEKLKKELNELRSIKRPKIIEAIAEARAHGDLKENAEYHAAKEQQSVSASHQTLCRKPQKAKLVRPQIRSPFQEHQALENAGNPLTQLPLT